MQFATTFQLGSIPNGFCSEINSTTDNIYIGSGNIFSGFWPYLSSIPGSYETTGNVIARAIFDATELPAGLERQKIYYLRKTGINVKVYLTFDDAQSETSHIDFTTNANGYLFSIYFLDIVYRHLNAWSPAAATLEEIPCCPDVPAVFKDCPSQGVINYGGQNRNLIRFGTFNNTDNGYGSLNSLKFQESFFNVYANEVQEFDFQINNFFHSWMGPYYPMNKPGIIIWVTGSFGLGRLFYEADELTLPTTTFTLMDILDYSILANQTTMTNAGLIPETLSITYSGQTNPPPQIRVVLPDAHFENYTYDLSNEYILKHINLGFIDEILTWDEDTLTYWSDLKIYAGIPGRIHLSLPNFYPLVSSGVNYISSDNSTGELSGFSGYTNSEFNGYQTLDFANIFDPAHPNQTVDTFIRIFAASDEYGCYPTGLPLGTIWIDSRVIWNIAATEEWPEDFSKRKAAKIALAFSRWGSAKYRRTNEPLTEQQGATIYSDHYKQNFYRVKSVHPDAYITSLGI